MKKFLAVYLGSETSPQAKEWDALDKKTREKREQEGMIAWQNWAQKHEKSIIDLGTPLGVTKLVNSKGVSDTENALTAYTVVQAESHEAAAKLFLDHPHFKIFPGYSIEVMECLPIPEM